LKIVLLSLLLTATGRAQIAIDSLTYEISPYGDVVLRWTIPQGTIVAKYTVYRGTDFDNMKVVADIPYPTVRQFTDHYSNVVPGTTYIYALKAEDINGKVARRYLEVLVTPPSTALHFTSVPPGTALVGTDYWYSPIRVDVSQQQDIEYAIVGPKPDGMMLNPVSGGLFTYIYWRPAAPGPYRVTLTARHKTTGAFAVQEFVINVASQAGYVRGTVLDVEGRPLPQTLVRVWQVQYAMLYEVRTDSAGAFFLPYVQIGELYAYARTASDAYVPQWYPLGRDISMVSSRTLKHRDTLVYEFHMLPKSGSVTRVTGAVRDVITGLPLDSASVAFIRKSNFINIGDTTVTRDPVARENFTIDTAVLTGVDGVFAANLEVGRDYYVEVRRGGYQTAFSVDRPNTTPTNALDARPLRVDGIPMDLRCSLTPDASTVNRIVGLVRSAVTGIDKQAVVVAISPDLKRGAGGGHTYRFRSTISDVNGYYAFDNLPVSDTYTILAVPLERNMAPTFFAPSGGSSFADLSEAVSPNGTVQGIDMNLDAMNAGGIGTFFGQVLLRTQTGSEPLPGSLVLALDAERNIVGYAVSDSTGWYSITGLPKNSYTLMAQHYSRGDGQTAPIELDYTYFNPFTSVKHADIVIDAGTLAVDPGAAPTAVTLSQNYPNPFNPTTSISFSLPQRAEATLRVLNAVGTAIATPHSGMTDAGTHTVSFDASGLATGIYYYQLQCGGTVLTRSMMVLK
jgi:hypothetical protein